jgi:putative membrane protein
VYRIGLIIVSIVAVTFGLLVGILNHDLVRVDLLWVQLDWPLGLLLLLSLAIGLLVGVSIAWLFTVIPLRLQLRRARRVAPGGIASTGGIAVTDRTND